MKLTRWQKKFLSIIAFAGLGMGLHSPVSAAPVPGGTLDPTTIPKYVTPLVIPPEMPKSTASPAPAANYDIAVRQFKQQILPGGIWGATFPGPNGTTINALPATTIWSYGRAEDPLPDSSGIPGGAAGIAPATNSSFNYPAFTLETTSGVASTVRWINDLVDPATGNFLPHLFSVDQTLHWANPPAANCTMPPFNRTDCETAIAAPYTGPVPLVTHVHGAHVQPHSDGYPEAWWLPAANNIPAGYASHGSIYTQGNDTNTVPGSAYYSYENTQPATTLWYHDHSLGMTRLNVYAGPAGFWLVRGGVNDTSAGVLPGPAPTIAGGDPNFSPAVRDSIREVPIVIQDRSFNSDGSLFYPADRTFFDGFTGPFIGGTGTPTGPSDISGIWNPEAFFNTMVVNGTTWPKYDVAPARYRLRLLDGCNSRTINLALFVVNSIGADGVPGTADDVLGAEVPFYQIGTEQGFLRQVVMITTGFATALPGDGTIPTPVAAPTPEQALLMGPAERADVIVDFSGMPDGTRIRMVNTAPDGPFGGFVGDPAADPLTSGQVMDFIVNSALTKPSDATTTLPQDLVLPAEGTLGTANITRQVSLNEMVSDQVCVEVDPLAGTIVQTLFSTTAGDPNFLANCAAATVAPGNIADVMGPRQALVGIVSASGGNLVAVPKRWMDPITETPSLNSTEVWEIFNTTMDAHPIHLHLVRFEVVNREDLDPTALAAGNLVPSGVTHAPNPNEVGYKDTVIAFPGQLTRIKAKFDISGLYVWHCHIVEHEDNEMMRPFFVGTPGQIDFNNDGKNDILWQNSTTGDLAVWYMNGVNMTSAVFLNPSKSGAANYNVVDVVDFNSDGKSDILWQNTATRDLVLWYMNGIDLASTATLNPPNAGAGNVNWSAIATADFNSDGKPDILWQNGVTEEMVVWQMNGTDLISSVGISPAKPGAPNWKFVGLGDFNNDLNTDILWQNSVSGDLVAWYMNGVNLTDSVALTPANSGAGIDWKAVSVHDYNNDGKPDILWQNSVTGDLVAWIMNGINLTESVALNPMNANNASWLVKK